MNDTKIGPKLQVGRHGPGRWYWMVSAYGRTTHPELGRCNFQQVYGHGETPSWSETFTVGPAALEVAVASEATS